jgi:hypothetical protein
MDWMRMSSVVCIAPSRAAHKRREQYSDFSRRSLEKFDSTAAVVAITQAIPPQNSKRVGKQEATGYQASENGKDAALIRAAWVCESY